MLHPLYELPIRWWNKEELLEEAIREKVNKFEWKAFEVGTSKARPIWNIEETPVGVKYFDEFKEMYGDVGEVSASYLYVDNGDEYAWHVDNGETPHGGHFNTVQRNKKKLTQCAINIILQGKENYVEFEGLPNQYYDGALFNTSHRHQSVPTSDKIIYKFSFKDKQYEEMKQIIQNGPINT